MDTDVKLFGLPPQVRMHSSAAAMTASFQVVAAGHFLLLVLQILRHPRTDRQSPPCENRDRDRHRRTGRSMRTRRGRGRTSARRRVWSKEEQWASGREGEGAGQGCSGGARGGGRHAQEGGAGYIGGRRPSPSLSLLSLLGSEAGLQGGGGGRSGEVESMAASDGGRLAADLVSSGATFASRNLGGSGVGDPGLLAPTGNIPTRETDGWGRSAAAQG